MPTENASMPGSAAVHPSLSSDEASQLGALKDALPGGWVVALQAEAGMAWLAFIYQADTPRGRPMFSVCRWDDGVGLFTQWMNGSACSAVAFTELWPILELILNDTFACTQAHPATMPTDDWVNTQH